MAIQGKSPFVLIVDDYRDAREMYSQYLAMSGFRVAEAKNGAEAIEKATAYQPDVVLLDLYLPGLDGWEVARRLKEDPRTQDAILVAFTAHSSPDAAARARAAGCAAFLLKPCLADALVREIKRLLDGMSTAPGRAGGGRAVAQDRALAADKPRKGAATRSHLPAPEEPEAV